MTVYFSIFIKQNPLLSLSYTFLVLHGGDEGKYFPVKGDLQRCHSSPQMERILLGGISAADHGGISAQQAQHGHVGGTSDILDFPHRWITQARNVLWGLLPTDGWVCFWVGELRPACVILCIKMARIACYQGLSLQLKLANIESDKSCGRSNACWKVIFPSLLKNKSIFLQLFLPNFDNWGNTTFAITQECAACFPVSPACCLLQQVLDTETLSPQSR